MNLETLYRQAKQNMNAEVLGEVVSVTDDVAAIVALLGVNTEMAVAILSHSDMPSARCGDLIYRMECAIDTGESFLSQTPRGTASRLGAIINLARSLKIHGLKEPLRKPTYIRRPTSIK